MPCGCICVRPWGKGAESDVCTLYMAAKVAFERISAGIGLVVAGCGWCC